jgi:GTPase
MTLPLVAVVGRPNVGKSTLFNRLVGGRPALVEDEPGVTRDRRYAEAEWNGRRFRIVDTGGLDPSAQGTVIGAGIHRQAERALEEADVIVFVTDVIHGLHPLDREVAVKLRRLGRPVVVVANKVDTKEKEVLAAEIWELGLGDVVPVSATHGRGAGDLCDAIVAALPEATDAEKEPPLPEAEATEEELANRPVRLAFLGRPNVGKSSLVNRLLGEERVLVHDQPGTTTDPVDTPFTLLGKDYVLVDTAGIRRKARIDAPTEKIAVSMSLGQIDRADVCVLVLDGSEGPTEQEARIGGAIEEGGRALVVVVNKDDLLGTGEQKRAAEKALEAKIRESMPFLSFAKICFSSATKGHGVVEIVEAARAAWDEHGRRIGTAELNRFFAEVCEHTPPPTFRGKAVRIYYLNQPVTHPPTFVLSANRPELVHYGYRRFLVNKMRERFGFEGTPIRIVTRRRGEKPRE